MAHPRFRHSLVKAEPYNSLFFVETFLHFLSEIAFPGWLRTVTVGGKGGENEVEANQLREATLETYGSELLQQALVA